MKTIRFNIPNGYNALDIREYTEGDQKYIEVDVIAKEDMCKIKMPHECGVDCKKVIHNK